MSFHVFLYYSYFNVISSKGGTEPEVVNFLYACYNHFRTKEQAESFISNWIKMFTCVAKDNIKKELLNSYRPSNI